MKRRIRWILPLALQLWLASASVWASEEGPETMGIPFSLVYWGINLLILVGILGYFLRKPAKEFFASRAALLQTNVTQAKELKIHAEKKYAEYETKLRNIEQETQDLVASLKMDGELEKRRLIQNAQEHVIALKSTSERVLAQELRKAKEELKRETVHLATGLAEDLLRKNLTAQDQAKIVEQYLQKMEKLG